VFFSFGSSFVGFHSGLGIGLDLVQMTAPFFGEDWESDTQEKLITARARLSAFIEATTDSSLKMQLKSTFDILVPCQDAIRLQSAFLLVRSCLLRYSSCEFRFGAG
jgi:hypothetical protein